MTARGSVGTLVFAAEDLLLSKLDSLAEVVIIPGPDGTVLPVISTKDNTPLDPADWRAATVDLPPMADPVHKPLAELPHTATTKIKRLELAATIASAGHADRGC